MIVNWTRDFLTGRTYQVRVRDQYSEVFSAYSGVPQGGVLSPLLFILYTYELPESVSRFGVVCKMYADDIKIYKSLEKAEDSCAIQAAIDYIDKWADTWELPIAPEKTKLNPAKAHNPPFQASGHDSGHKIHDNKNRHIRPRPSIQHLAAIDTAIGTLLLVCTSKMADENLGKFWPRLALHSASQANESRKRIERKSGGSWHHKVNDQ
ncbi:hypothetical protein Y032_0486g2333 [Ancylostoma ceylanicum]|nr:hypothetical protein Y032_0486g2333 [Ancylostoma ceylanicum]